MAPPANTAATTALSLGTLPANVTQTDINDAGVNYTVWYKFTAPAGAKVIGAWAFSGNIGAGYRPTLRPYVGPAASPTLILSIGAQNKPIQFPVTPGVEYFLQAVKNIDTAGPEDLNIRVEVAPDLAFVAGTILVNDDAPGFPLAGLSGASDHTVRGFVKDIVSGEAGDILHATDTVLLSDDFNALDFRVYNNAWAQLAAIAAPQTGTQRARGNQTLGKFYIGGAGSMPSTVAKVQPVLPDGTTGAIVSLPDPLLQSFCPNNDETILYYNRGTSEPVKRVSLPSGAPQADFVAAVTNYKNDDILIVPDGSILISYYKSTVTRDLFVRRYNAAGTLLNTYAFGSDHEAATPPRLAYALDASSFWVWTHPVTEYPSGVSKFQNIRMSDGAVLAVRLHTEYEGGAYQQAETATPTARFGNSSSCPFMVAAGVADGGTGEEIAGNYRVIRRMRQAPHVLEETLTFAVDRFEMILETERVYSYGQGSDPKIMISMSKDRGRTFGPERVIPTGKIGEFRKRVLTRRWGTARDVVFRVVVSDPVPWHIIGAIIDVTPGSG